MSAGGRRRPSAPPAPPPGPSGLALLLDRLREKLGAANVEEADGGAHIRCSPGVAAEVAEALHAAAVGGVRASASGAPEALLHLDLSRLCALSIDETSLLCTAGAGLTLSAIEVALRERGLSLGPLPAPSLRRSLGAALGVPRPADATPLLGRLRDRPVRIEAVLPDRQKVLLPVLPAPRRAAGPDLKQLVIGGAGRSGILTAATLPIVRPGPVLRCLGWMLPAARGAEVLCELLRRSGGVGPADLQLLGREILLPLSPDLPAGAAALLLRAEGPAAVVEALATLGAALCEGAPPVPEALCQAWLDGADEAAWPAAQRAIAAPTPAELGQLFSACAAPRLVCGVHLHGAALCAAPAALRSLPPVADAESSAAAARLFELLRAQLDPHALLC